MKKNSVAFSGIIVSLSLVSLFLTGIFPFADYALPAIAGGLLALTLIEINFKFAVISYICVSILSIFISPNKESAVLFVSFFGYYPIVKSLFEKSKSRVIEWILKFLTVNFGIGICFIIAYYLFNIKEIIESIETFRKYGDLAIFIGLGMLNIVFVVYDIAVTRIICSYMNWFRPKYLKHFN